MEKKQAVREAKKGTSPAADGMAGEHDDRVAAAHPDAQGEGAPEEAAGADVEGHASGLIFPLSYPVDLAGLRESLPFLREHGLNAEVDLSDTTYNGEVAIRDLERLAIELRRNKTKVIARLPHHDLKLASHDKMILQHSMEAIQEGLEIGKILGARIAIFHSGFSNHVRPDEIDWWVEQSVTSLRDLVARAKEEEVIVALRNTWESDEQVLARLFEAVDSPWFRFCCDVGHAACFSQFAPEDWIVQFRERLVNLHFHDNDGISDLHQVCGKGVVGFDVIYETIREQLSEPVNITLQVSREDLEPSIQHLESCGFHFDRSR